MASGTPTDEALGAGVARAWILPRSFEEMRLRNLIAAGATACAAGFHPLSAQVGPRGMPPELSSDSTAWQRVLTYVVGTLSTTIVRASVDPAPQPWQIRVPADEPQRLLLERQLTTILRARPVADRDTIIYTLELGPLSVQNDGARVVVRTDVVQRCASSSRLAGYGNVDSVFVPRAPQGFWGAARTTGVMHGDRVPCPRLRQ
jgi:hypothetical protein